MSLALVPKPEVSTSIFSVAVQNGSGTTWVTEKMRKKIVLRVTLFLNSLSVQGNVRAYIGVRSEKNFPNGFTFDRVTGKKTRQYKVNTAGMKFLINFSGGENWR